MMLESSNRSRAELERVLISGGREVGGLGSFAAALRCGFEALGMPAQVVSPQSIMRRWRDLRDPRVLKILSTSAAFAAPVARRTICVAHGFPRADSMGWAKLSAVLSTHKLANASPGVQLVAVSHYCAVHLRTIFNLMIDAVIHNPLHPLFLEDGNEVKAERHFITYVGRLIDPKNLHRLIEPMRNLLDEEPALRVCIMGDGDQREKLEALAGGDSRFVFMGAQEPAIVRQQLQRTRLFVSGCETEALGLTYLEAIAQGCVVAMPACGGGIEIAPSQVGTCVHLLPLSFEHGATLAALRRALHSDPEPMDMSPWSAEAVARQYLKVDARFDAEGKYRPSRVSPHGPGAR